MMEAGPANANANRPSAAGAATNPEAGRPIPEATSAPGCRPVIVQLVLLVIGVLLGGILGFIGSLAAGAAYRRWFETPLLVPVLIQGQDRQGGQFALGVSRAMEVARRYHLDEIDGHPVKPVLLDERIVDDNGNIDTKRVDDVVAKIKDCDPPIVVGPLHSTSAIELAPRIANSSGLGAPMILGIPTNPDITKHHSEHRIWRLSPTDNSQGALVAQLYAFVTPVNQPAILITEVEQNPGYAAKLTEIISNRIPDFSRPRLLSPAKIAVKRGDYASIEQRFKTAPPTTIIYVGMPKMAGELLARARDAHLHATWIFTDSCITDPEDLVRKVSDVSGTFYITFQAPSADHSQGFQQYMSYTRSIGGRVLLALEDDSNRQCNAMEAAPSYEVFGYDSYLIALKLMARAAANKPQPGWREIIRGGYPTFLRRGIATLMGVELKITDPMLITGEYDFNEQGDSTNLAFYVYRIADGCTKYFADPTELGKKTPAPTVD